MKPELGLVGLAGPEIGAWMLVDDALRHAQGAGQRPHLRLVEVADGVDGGRHVAVDGAVAEKELCLVAGAQHECAECCRVIVEDRHAFTRHLVAAAHRVRVREAGEVGVDLRRDVDPHRPDTSRLHDPVRVGDAVRARTAVRQDEAGDVLGAQRRRRQVRHKRRIDPAREPEHSTPHAALVHLVADEGNEHPLQEIGVGLALSVALPQPLDVRRMRGG